METIQELVKINYVYVLASVFTTLIGVKAIVSLFEWVVDKLGLETKWMKRKREEHDLLIKTSENLSALQEQHTSDMQYSNKRDDEINRDIQNLTAMFLDKEIDDWRWKILDFSSALSNGRKYNRESFDHVIKIYGKYEKILEDNKMENGLVEESMKFIRKKYQEYLDRGFWNQENGDFNVP